jgi:hypothetical protein
MCSQRLTRWCEGYYRFAELLNWVRLQRLIFTFANQSLIELSYDFTDFGNGYCEYYLGL